MLDFFIHVLRKLGFNRAISYGVLTRIWCMLSGPVTILMIATRLTEVQQGFYYTISSLLALQIFFELGLVTVMSQFASHEFIHLRWGALGRIEGDNVARERFLDLMGKGVTWFATASLLLIAVLIPVGLLFLGNKQGLATDFSWRLPWSLAVIGTAMNLLIVPFFAIIMGSGDVQSVNHREMMGAIAGSCLCWLVLGMHGELYAVFAITSGNSIISWFYLIRQKPYLLKYIWCFFTDKKEKTYKRETISWWGEVWPMQWKIALTWITGYFVFQLFTPVLFHYQGAIIAGQMGMTMSAANALLAISLTWISSRSPEFGKLVATRNWTKLDELSRMVSLQSFVVAVIGAAAGWGLLSVLQAYFSIGSRFLPANQAVLLFAAVCFQVIISGLGAYLRAHKQEPFLPLSVSLGFLQGGATWFFGMKFSSLEVAASYLFITLFIALPCSFLIWQHFRNKWHSPIDASRSDIQTLEADMHKMIKYPCMKKLSSDTGISQDNLLKAFNIEKCFHIDVLKEEDAEKRKKLYQDVYQEVHSIYGARPIAGSRRNPKDKIARLFRKELEGKSILEVGCGDGLFLNSVAGTLMHNELVGLDISATALPNRHAEIQFINADIIDFDLQKKFDVVYSEHVIEHIAPLDLPIHLRSVKNALKDDGIFIVCAPNKLFGPSDVTRIIDYSYTNRIPAMGTHLNEPTYTELVRILQDNGFNRFKTVLPLPKIKYLFPTLRLDPAIMIKIEENSILLKLLHSFKLKSRCMARFDTVLICMQ